MSVIINPNAASQAAQAYKGTDLEGLAPKPQTGLPQGPGTNAIDQFTEVLKTKVNQVNETMAAGDQKIEDYVRGKEDSVHDVMIAMTKADISFKLMTTVGRKVIEAYQDIMRMQV